MKTVLICAALLTMTLPAGAQIKRCTIDDKIVFSDLPCPTGAASEAVRIFDRGPTATDAAAAKERSRRLREQVEQIDEMRSRQQEEIRKRSQEALDELQHLARSREAIRQRRVFVGMAADDAQQSWGTPTTINRSHSARGTKEQWVYQNGPAKARYVYVEDGQVTAVRE